MNEEEMLAKIEELSKANEELTAKLEERNKAFETIKERLDKANELSQTLISRYALKDSPVNKVEEQELSMDERILKAYKGE